MREKTLNTEPSSALGLTQPQASRYLEELLQAIPVGVATIDAHGVMLACNRTAEDILSATRRKGASDAVVGAPIARFFIDAGRLTETIEAGFADEAPSEVFERTGASPARFVEITARRLPSAAGAPVAMLVLQDVTKRVADERALKRAVLDREFLTQSGTELSKSLDYQTTLDTFVALTVSYLCDWSTVNMVADDGVITRAAVAHVDPAKESLIVELHESHPHDPNATTGVPRVLRTGEPEIYGEIDAQLLRETANNPEYLRIVSELGMHSCMIVPLVAHGETLGAATLVSSHSERRYDHADLELTVELARRAALQLYNARLFQAVDESRVKFSTMARILQRSLLPPELPSIRGFDVAALYRPAAETLEVGGDFYDLFETTDGDWGVVMGDVQGHGAAAAATTALARYTLRANAMRLTRPVHVLYQVNKALLRQSEERFLSAVFATISLDQSPRITIASAGHPKPMVIRQSGMVESAGGDGMLLGLFAAPDLSEHTIQLEQGDALVLFTDGLTEAGAPRNMLGEEGFRQVLRRCLGMSAGDICASIDEVLMTWQGEKGHRDDCAALVLRVSTDAERKSAAIPEKGSSLI
ncbi:MAG: SpoIIE family protein phosphatase [Actinomycetota bacterium]